HRRHAVLAGRGQRALRLPRRQRGSAACLGAPAVWVAGRHAAVSLPRLPYRRRGAAQHGDGARAARAQRAPRRRHDGGGVRGAARTPRRHAGDAAAVLAGAAAQHSRGRTAAGERRGAALPETAAGRRRAGSMGMSTAFTPWSALGGGILIGLASLLLLVALGRIAGISGIAAGLLPPRRGDIGWRLAFVIGLPMGAALWMLDAGGAAVASHAPPWQLALAGLLVGVGTRVGS